MGRSYTGNRCLLVTSVRGRSRVPNPPARIMPFTSAILLEVDAVVGAIWYGKATGAVHRGTCPATSQNQSPFMLWQLILRSNDFFVCFDPLEEFLEAFLLRRIGLTNALHPIL